MHFFSWYSPYFYLWCSVPLGNAMLEIMRFIVQALPNDSATGITLDACGAVLGITLMALYLKGRLLLLICCQDAKVVLLLGIFFFLEGPRIERRVSPIPHKTSANALLLSHNPQNLVLKFQVVNVY